MTSMQATRASSAYTYFFKVVQIYLTTIAGLPGNMLLSCTMYRMFFQGRIAVFRRINCSISCREQCICKKAVLSLREDGMFCP